MTDPFLFEGGLPRRHEGYSTQLSEVAAEHGERLDALVEGYDRTMRDLVGQYGEGLRSNNTADALGLFGPMRDLVGQTVNAHARVVEEHLTYTAGRVEGMLSQHDQGVLAELRVIAADSRRGVTNSSYAEARQKVSCEEAGFAIDAAMDRDVCVAAHKKAADRVFGMTKVPSHPTEYVHAVCDVSPNSAALKSTLDVEVYNVVQATAADRVFGVSQVSSSKEYTDRASGMSVHAGAMKSTVDATVARTVRATAADRVFGLSFVGGTNWVEGVCDLGSNPMVVSHLRASVGLPPKVDARSETRAAYREMTGYRGRRHGIRAGLAMVAAVSFGIGLGVTSLVYHPGSAAPNKVPPAAGALPAAPSTHTPHSARPTPNNTPSPKSTHNSPMTPAEYYASAQRNALIGPIVVKFGRLVVSQSETQDSGWGPFDAYCSPVDGVGDYVSRGYVPRPGDICTPQHNRQYGGGNGQSVSADVVVGSNGKYTDRIVGAGAILDNCDVTFSYSDGSWNVQIGNAESQFEPSIAAIKANDAAGLACVEKAHP